MQVVASQAGGHHTGCLQGSDSLMVASARALSSRSHAARKYAPSLAPHPRPLPRQFTVTVPVSLLQCRQGRTRMDGWMELYAACNWYVLATCCDYVVLV
jgi:hypothetical protein